eukprot:Hpha_TRINITY_DN28148_c0_g1::TRINITY_DN28148_c0_g1_i1::g.103274::m.103274/K09571/FKBP4_5; FK506-binding protein 4/5
MGLEDLDLGEHYRFVKDVVQDEEVDVTSDTMVKKKCLVKGGSSGRPGDGSRVTVHYTWKLSDGTLLKETRDGEPETFRLGQGTLTQGFDLAVKTMRIGEKAEVTVKHKYGYGLKGNEEKGVPGGAVMVFVVELLSFSYVDDLTEDKQGGVVKEIVTSGPQGGVKAIYESRVVADVLVQEEDSPDAPAGRTVFEREGWSFVSGDEPLLPKGVDLGVAAMLPGETSVIHISPAFGFAKGEAPEGWPTGVYLRATIALKEVDIPADCWVRGGGENWDLTFEDFLEGAERRKAEANTLYKERQFNRAQKKYSSGVRLLDAERLDTLCKSAEDKDKYDEERVKRKNAIKLQLLNNLTAVHLAAKEWVQAVVQAGLAVAVDDKCAKAYLRRAKAHNQLGDFELARKDLDLILSDLEPTNEEAVKELEVLKKKRTQFQQKERAAFGKMFATKEP